jgi:hypothetical protein
MSFSDFLNTRYQRHIRAKSFVGSSLRKFRRFYLGIFGQDYIRKAISEKRTGDCNHCGACCELVYRCPFLGKDADGLSFCRVYGGLRPMNCRYYPFDSIDAEIDECSYKFKD